MREAPGDPEISPSAGCGFRSERGARLDPDACREIGAPSGRAARGGGTNPFLGPAAENPLPGHTARSGSGDAALDPRAEGSSPELRGTVVSGATAMAIFGNRLVPVGGKAGDWTLSGVEPYRVFLRRGAETRVLELYKQ